MRISANEPFRSFGKRAANFSAEAYSHAKSRRLGVVSREASEELRGFFLWEFHAYIRIVRARCVRACVTRRAGACIPMQIALSAVRSPLSFSYSLFSSPVRHRVEALVQRQINRGPVASHRDGKFAHPVARKTFYPITCYVILSESLTSLFDVKSLFVVKSLFHVKLKECTYNSKIYNTKKYIDIMRDNMPKIHLIKAKFKRFLKNYNARQIWKGQMDRGCENLYTIVIIMQLSHSFLIHMTLPNLMHIMIFQEMLKFSF